jgi:hypothetical protein
MTYMPRPPKDLVKSDFSVTDIRPDENSGIGLPLVITVHAEIVALHIAVLADPYPA